ncbi:MAG: stage II sporulation protein R [Desulfitobacteriaceae bacterium]
MKIRKSRLFTIGSEKSRGKEVRRIYRGLNKGIALLVLVIIFLMVTFGVFAKERTADNSKEFLHLYDAHVITNQPAENGAQEFWSSADIVNKLIRFHVVGNSDSESDQALKRAIRDALLVKVSPKLAKSQSLQESRLLLKSLRPEMESIARSIVQIWGKNEQIRSDYGRFQFPTKSYGSIVLPAGEYEAVRILIGKAEGANWWCVLFPPLCFVNIEHSTAIPVDGKPAIPLQKSAYQEVAKVEVRNDTKVIKFWFWEKMLKLMHNA